jgi:hypothetical protein
VARKVCFFEKKQQKTFVTRGTRASSRPTVAGKGKRAKVFWFFFSKKNACLSKNAYFSLGGPIKAG